MNNDTLQIALFDDHPLITNGLSALLAQHSNYKVVVSANQPDALLAALRSHQADVLVLDIVAPGVDGLDLFKTIRKEHPELLIIAHSSLTSTVLVENLLHMGIRGFVNKRQPPETIFTAIDEVIQQRIYVPESYRFLVKHVSSIEPTEDLSPREKEILNLIAKGHPTKAIADTLFIATNTVENHRANLFRKFQVKNVAELLRQAMRLGYLSD